ncbi:MAG: EamA family transporter [Bdellovibrionales bacterium]|nr:EamA family transporter [Bdellovibrionales bacterium]
MFYAILSAVFSSGKDLFSKRIAFEISGTLSAFASFAYALPFYFVVSVSLLWMGYEEIPFSRDFWILVLLRSATDSAAEWCKMQSIAKADISFISPLLSLSPLFLLVTSPLITGDEVGTRGTFGVVFVVLGSILLMYRPAKGAFTWQAVGFALGASLFFSLNSCFDRLAVQVASPVMSGFAMTLLAALVLFPLAFRSGQLRWELKKVSCLLWGRGLLELAFMVSKLTALRYLQAPYVASLGKTSNLLSVLGGRFLFREGDFVRRLVATALMIFGISQIILVSI